MFEVTGSDIQLRDDKQLRTLVARLCLAELRSMDLPVSGVTAEFKARVVLKNKRWRIAKLEID